MAKYITKMDYEQATGYMVRVPEFINGKAVPYKESVISEFFNRNNYPSWSTCLSAAKSWRNNYLKDNHATDLLKAMRVGIPRRSFNTNTSGIIGVQCYWDGNHEFYRGYFSDCNGQHKKSFSVNKWGEDEAYNKACEYRFKHSGVLIVTDVSILPSLPAYDYIIKEDYYL